MALKLLSELLSKELRRTSSELSVYLLQEMLSKVRFV